MRCPICKKEVSFDAPEMPFCSKRCRMIDLGNWADESYRISTPAQGDFRAFDEEKDESEAR